MENLIPKLISLLLSPSFTGLLLALKLTFILSSLIFLVAIIYFLINSSYFRYFIWYDIVEFFTFRSYGVKKIERVWQKTKVRADTGLESEYKLAVMEADSMMDDILKRMGYVGETLGERLKALTAATIPNIEEIKEAHKIRNSIIHDPDYRLSLDETRKALAMYEQAFRDLQAF